jgi:dolichyl-diphosphooligosaccharide--protein glycosyltransferase
MRFKLPDLPDFPELPGSERFKSKKFTILVYACLASILALAIVIRLLPLQWGVHLDEFDPYIQYKGASYIVNNGFMAYFNWFDPTRWAPWGANVGSELPFGTPATGAAAYLLLNFIGINIPLLDTVCFWPVFSAALCTVMLFFIGSFLVNRGVGLFTALIFAIDPTSIQRTSFGFFDDETTGLLGMFAAILFFLLAIRSEKLWKNIFYSVISGLGLAYMSLSWGAYLYPLNLFALFVIIFAVFGRWSRRLAIPITIITSITMFALAINPNHGISQAISPYTITPILAVILSVVLGLFEHIEDDVRRRKMSIISVLGIVVGFLVLTVAGVFGAIGGKLLNFIDIVARLSSPIVGTVGEQFPSIWFNYFYTYHILIILGAVGAYIAVKRQKYRDIFIVLFGLMAIYGAASYVRLMIVVAPSIALLAGLAMTSILGYAYQLIKQKGEKKGRATFLNKWYGILIIIIILVAMVPIVYPNIQAADRPTMIVSASTSYVAEIPDWEEALSWMASNIPATAVVGEWWDYGYWINVMGNCTVISDNSTTNSTQITLIADAFLNNETYALSIFKSMNVSYVVVFEPWTYYNVGNNTIGLPPWSQLGDFEKSTAMMSIAGYNVSNYIKDVSISTGSSTISWPLPAGPSAANCTLYQMLFDPWTAGYATLGVTIQPLQHMSLVYASPNYWVLIYKISYP